MTEQTHCYDESACDFGNMVTDEHKWVVGQIEATHVHIFCVICRSKMRVPKKRAGITPMSIVSTK